MRFRDKYRLLCLKINDNIWFHLKNINRWLFICMYEIIRFLFWRNRHFERLPFPRRGVTLACQWLSSGQQSSWHPVLYHVSSQTGNYPVYPRLVCFTFMLDCTVMFVSHVWHLMYLLSYCHFNCMRYFPFEQMTDACIFTALLLKFS